MYIGHIILMIYQIILINNVYNILLAYYKNNKIYSIT